MKGREKKERKNVQVKDISANKKGIERNDSRSEKKKSERRREREKERKREREKERKREREKERKRERENYIKTIQRLEIPREKKENNKKKGLYREGKFFNE
jgi:hypothetical protein